MAEHSTISWTHHTFNPWIGCTKVSPGCLHCYAERDNARRQWNRDGWGKGVPRKRTSEANWKEPLRWNAAAEKSGTRTRVFCASLADWLDDEVPAVWLFDLLTLIHRTPQLDWLLLTKRPENFETRLRAAAAQCTIDPLDITDRIYAWLEARETGSRIPWNVWIGTTVEDQQRADERIPALLNIPARVRFLSCEPLLGPVKLRQDWIEAELQTTSSYFPRVNWIICGGESGPVARPMQAVWAQSLRDQSEAADVAFHFKQWGEWVPIGQEPEDLHGSQIKGSSTPPGVWLVGKKTAGRLLDGREWNEVPR